MRKPVAGRQEQRLPIGVRRDSRQRSGGLDENDPRAVAPKIRAREDAGLGAFDVDLEEMHLACHVRIEDFGERHRRHFAHVPANPARVCRCAIAASRVDSPVPAYSCSCHRTASLGHRDRKVDVARSRLHEPVMPFRDRLNIDAGPPALVERTRHGMQVRIVGADVHVASDLDVAQHLRQKRILSVLRVRNEGRGGRGRRFRRTSAAPAGACVRLHGGWVEYAELEQPLPKQACRVLTREPVANGVLSGGRKPGPQCRVVGERAHVARRAFDIGIGPDEALVVDEVLAARDRDEPVVDEQAIATSFMNSRLPE